jgi:membrane protein DedA with SNARE-associated domain
LPLDPSFLETGAGALASYALITALVAADGVFPVFPGEAALIGGAILAADGDLAIGAVIAAGMVGGAAGDNLSYLLGSRYGPPAAARMFRSERSKRRLDWARTRLEERGEVIILTARFIPAGRTATTFASGALGMAWRRFASVDLVAVAAWALYACLAGYLGGRAFGDSTLSVMLAAIMIATVIGLGAEVIRRLRADG